MKREKSEWIITDFETAERIVCLLNKYEWKPPTQNVWGIVDLWKDEWWVALFDECITEPNLDYTYMKWYVRKYKENKSYIFLCCIACWFLWAFMMWWLTLLVFLKSWWVDALLFFFLFRTIVSFVLYAKER